MPKLDIYPTGWSKEIAKALLEPFPDSTIKERPIAQGLMAKYIDARAVQERLDKVVGPPNWSFEWTDVDRSVKGSLTILGVTKEDSGYPNSADDAEPFKSAVSDALKRCAVQFGVGRHLYEETPHQGTSQTSARTTTAPRKTQEELKSDLKMDDNQVTPKCNLCSNDMMVRKGSRGPFWGCTTYPTCKNIYNIGQVDVEGNVTKEGEEDPNPGINSDDLPF